MIAVTGGSAALAGGVLAASSGWTSPTGLAAFITALVGAGAFIWSVYQGTKRRHEIDIDAAREFVKLLKEADDDAS